MKTGSWLVQNRTNGKGWANGYRGSVNINEARRRVIAAKETEQDALRDLADARRQHNELMIGAHKKNKRFDVRDIFKYRLKVEKKG